ncbi:putative thiazole-containing bacteriocin maturation protein [Bacillus sp. ISL-37]|jgi:putative thiazole-containing bacteriocin maturation protein|uniref:putative thiazole-containing bacteriocin maturation protein n=1 Tax=Bacillus sp. ISL-37 TaxID=2819123 RepID=UPI001BE9EB2B|nr:putative thiazole-containing bacteriocin maturation protein [Bacillus sp. ISL-37]MBT2682698.1 putative thiazole-containing bacteriocin maturation protein [Bacillus sp. ISL-37]
MVKVNPSMRLKVKRDTFYLPEPNRGVYLRNNSVSFRLEGTGVEKWVEKLLPMFNGEHSLEKLTEGLPGPYRDRVLEIAEVLYRNGFVRDTSQDSPHDLSEKVLKKYAAQIEFVDNLAGSGASRFQAFRHANVLAAGSGPILNSLVSSLLQSGLPKLNVLITDEIPTSRKRLSEIVNHALKGDPEVELQVIELEGEGWREVLQPFDSVLYVSQNGNLEELRVLQAVCRQEKKAFIPAILLKQTGIAGPVFVPDSEICWESAWRRLHSSVLEKEQQVPAASATTGALLANMITFELFKEATGVSKEKQRNRIYLLDLETLEGSWHSFLPHPLETGVPAAKRIEDLESRLEQDLNRTEPEKLLQAFILLTSKETGILHQWEEGELKQLPLAQCRVQAVDPLSAGPAVLLGERICSGFTHEEARREAALAGVESYASRLASLLQNDDFLGVGTGETFQEAVSRGLQKCLVEQLDQQRQQHEQYICPVELDAVEDERCRFYLEALTTMQGAPIIGLGKEVSGFPSIWVGTSSGWYGSTDLNLTLALRGALQQALFKHQNDSERNYTKVLDKSTVQLDEKVKPRLIIPSYEERIQSETMKEAVEVLKRNGKQLYVYELKLEPVFNQELVGVFGVLLREEGLQ